MRDLLWSSILLPVEPDAAGIRGPGWQSNAHTGHPEEQYDRIRIDYEQAGIKRRLGFGTRPAIVVVDLSNAFTHATTAVGSDLNDVVASTRLLLDAARAANVSIVFTTISYAPSLADAALWQQKSPVLATLREGTPLVDIDERLGKRTGELLVVKKGASAFFGTNLAAVLAAWRVDTVVVAGTSTSGCVRATVVDAMQYGFRPIVPVECVGDRDVEPHRASLFDIDAKYGDVVPLDEVLANLRPESHEPSDRANLESEEIL